MNWVSFPNQSFNRVKIGSMDPHKEAFYLNDGAITWPSWLNQVGSHFKSSEKSSSSDKFSALLLYIVVHKNGRTDKPLMNKQQCQTRKG